MTIEERFWAHVPERPEDGCWEWTGTRETRMGYGEFVVDRGGPRYKTEMAHRVAFELTHGAPSGFVLHRCDNPPCVRPEHLYDGTHQQNMDDRESRGRTFRGRPKPGHICRGTEHPRAKLDEAAVREIRRRYSAGGVSQQALANEYGVAQTKVSSIVRGRSWKHVEEVKI
jgi:hypothetical protein